MWFDRKNISRRCSKSLKCLDKNGNWIKRESISWTQRRNVFQEKKDTKIKATKQIASMDNVYVSKLSTSIYSYRYASSASSSIALKAEVHSGSKSLKPARNKLIWISLMCSFQFLCNIFIFGKSISNQIAGVKNHQRYIVCASVLFQGYLCASKQV